VFVCLMVFNFFETDYLKGKRVIMIANNPDLKKGNFELDIDDDDVVIRFAGDKFNLIESIYKGRTDIMVYRSGRTYFNAFDWDNVKGKKQLFLLYNPVMVVKKDREFKDEHIMPTLMKQINRCKIENRYIGYMGDIAGGSPTQGFGLLVRLLMRMDCEDIVLCGFTNLTRTNIKKGTMYGVHNIFNENYIFRNYIMKNSQFKNKNKNKNKNKIIKIGC